MQVLALNSSPRPEGQSKTAVMLQHLVEGLREGGAGVEVIALREKRLQDCIGCFTCWTRTPGACLLKDDMSAELYPRWLAADLVVYASPLYFHTVNAAMARFIERTLPAVQPFFETAAGRIRHPLRHPMPTAVWLVVSGLPEMAEFDALREFLRRTRHPGVEVAAEIYRPGAEMLTNPICRAAAAEVFEATRAAGRELARARRVSPETLERIRRPLVDPQSFVRLGNLFWRTCIAEGVNPREFDARRMVPRPATLEDFLLLMPYGLNAHCAPPQGAVLQFTFTGAVPESCHFLVSQGQVTAHPGPADHPDVTIETPFALWLDVITGKADGQQLYFAQGYRVEGDLTLMLQLLQARKGPDRESP
jgi:hypothetical protein